MEKLTNQEERVMLLIWRRGEGTIREYHEMNENPQMPYTTFASIVKNLQKKGYLKMRRIGTTYLCRPDIKEEDYKSNFMSGFICNYFKNSYKEMVSFFAKEEKLSAKDLEDILRIIEQRK
ncbi:MAG TPA: transcriptional regulator [Porphyromonadaceae bacterium]|nr:transcriptional regulator [Porphyromonadaceae bacterium]